KNFFMKIYNSNCNKICIENPVPSRVFDLPLKSQIIQPYQFGHNYRKKTYLWLKGLPDLVPTKVVTSGIVNFINGGSKDHVGNSRKTKSTKLRSSKDRSKTFQGIADAMADQWSNLI